MTAYQISKSAEQESPRAVMPGQQRTLGFVMIAIAIISGVITFLILTGLTPVNPTPDVGIAAAAINGTIILALVYLVGHEAYSLIRARRQGHAAARLHIQIVTLFSVISAVPAIILAILASLTLEYQLDRWFSDRTRQIVQNAITVAHAYRAEHIGVLRNELISTGADVDRARDLYFNDPSRFDQFLQTQSTLRRIPLVMLIDGTGAVMTRTSLDPNIRNIKPPSDAIPQAKELNGAPAMIDSGVTDLFGGIIKLQAYDDLYLFVVRRLDTRVSSHMNQVRLNAEQYRELEESRFTTQIAFAFIFTGLGLILLLASIWIGIGFAERLMMPIRRLIFAADQISSGNLEVTVPVPGARSDLDNLSSTFNNMSTQLRAQRSELIDASEQNRRRRRFTEAVLSGVTVGVLGIDPSGRISLANPSALDVLDTSSGDLVGQEFSSAVPEISQILNRAILEERTSLSEQVTIMRHGRERIVNVRVTTERPTQNEHGYVVTLDDISELITANRRSAWGDVARRIAHEIKNPLTPIQLSAERLRRRYGRKLTEDKEVFDQCVDTIVRQVGDIGRMVDEFSSFARMPKPTFEQRNLTEAIREAIFLHSVSNSEIEYRMQGLDEEVLAHFDHRLIVQAVSNVVKNASESVMAVTRDEGEQGFVSIALYQSEANFIVEVCDNGKGLPLENRNQLLEPYMTTREKGTGLGLPIVQKIFQEHGGDIELLDAPDLEEGKTGALVRLTISADKSIATDQNDEGK